MIIYIKHQGSRIEKEGRHLLLRKLDHSSETIFLASLEMLVLMGRIEVSSSALALLFKLNIEVVFLSQFGRYKGRLQNIENKNIVLRVKQYKKLEDEAFKINFVRSIVKGKLKNLAVYVGRIKRSRNLPLLQKTVDSINLAASSVENYSTIDSIRGVEGYGTSLYFGVFSQAFIKDVGFRKRVRRPPTDPVNSVLSLLYTFLMNRVYAAVRQVGLDPYVGYLHSIDYGRYSLVLDLMEEFRPLIADTLTVSLFNLNVLKLEHFEVREFNNFDDDITEDIRSDRKQLLEAVNDPIARINLDSLHFETFDLPEQDMVDHVSQETVISDKKPVIIKDEAMKLIIAAFEEKMLSRFFHPVLEREVSYADSIIQQAYHFVKVLNEEESLYKSLLLR